MIKNFHKVKTGEEGLEYLANHEPPELILLDLQLSGTHGWEFFHRYKESTQNTTTEIVISSGSTNRTNLQQAEDLGLKYINKPLEEATLRKLIERNTKYRKASGE